MPARTRWDTAPPEDRDAAKRIKDAHNLHLIVLGIDAAGKFIAHRLQDGTGGEDLYDTRADAERHNDAYRHVFVQIQMMPMTEIEALVVLTFARDVSRRGGRMARIPQNPRPDRKFTIS